MTRSGTDDFRAESAFLDALSDRLQSQLARQAGRISVESPELAAEVQQLIATPFAQWPAGVGAELQSAIGALKQEEAIIDDLRRAIDARPLTGEIEKRIASLERQESTLEADEPARYLSESAYWRAGRTQAILNQLFQSWSGWQRGEPPGLS